MTASQRKVHLLIWLIVAPLALVGLVVALMQGPAEPIEQGPLPGVVDPDPAPQDDAGARP